MIVRFVRLGAVLAMLCFGAIPPTLAAPGRFAPIRLPADAAMHPAAPNEWWYFTGHLRDSAGHAYGFELVTFKLGNARQLDPLLPVKTLYRIDLAITDEAHKSFSSTVTYLFPAAGKTVLSSRRLTVHMPGQGASLSLDTLPGPGLAYHLRGRLKAGSVDLAVRTTRPPLIEGEQGVEQISDGYSYYYSLPYLRTTGTLTLHGRRVPVAGLTWMDHQWGVWSWSKQKGWDWMAIQLNDGTSLSLLNFTAGPHTTAKYSGISFADGTQRFTRRASMVPLGPTWTSPRSHLSYALAWHVQVPAIKLDAVVTAAVPNQELVDSLDPYSTYWEGSGRLTGTLAGRPIRGRTYTELAGYAQPRHGTAP
jgi:predicted secreted hydrolase